MARGQLLVHRADELARADDLQAHDRLEQDRVGVPAGLPERRTAALRKASSLESISFDEPPVSVTPTSSTG